MVKLLLMAAHFSCVCVRNVDCPCSHNLDYSLFKMAHERSNLTPDHTLMLTWHFYTETFWFWCDCVPFFQVRVHSLLSCTGFEIFCCHFCHLLHMTFSFLFFFLTCHGRVCPFRVVASGTQYFHDSLTTVLLQIRRRDMHTHFFFLSFLTFFFFV